MNNQPFETERMHPGQCQSIYAMVFSATFCTNTQGDRELVWASKVWCFWHSQCSNNSFNSIFCLINWNWKGIKTRKLEGTTWSSVHPHACPAPHTPQSHCLLKLSLLAILDFLVWLPHGWNSSILREEYTAYFCCLPHKQALRQATS